MAVDQDSVFLREAVPNDAYALAELAEATFRAAFAAQNTEEDMASHCAANYSEALQGAEIARDDYRTFVMENQGRLIAYAQLRTGAAPVCVSRDFPIEIQRFYVDAIWHGKGIAPRLMQACLDTAQAQGTKTVWLGVWENNPKAIAFYSKFGFAEVGAHTFVVGSDPQTDLIMQRTV
ncbi:N-acetyltransferase [Arenicella chitinivorans]|uniref:N-acetyltransferase n=1 Tax=Arenicella chitinivorans TaxID=1329800 RepID=A0A918VSC5_9GAMM|nr:GNAT family N-acetyltransferase [Arenicella chitinivorans]GHA20260.1 N-acetyltransferase [Arenicella chitinivorans]